MRKTLVSIVWIILLEVVFYAVYIWLLFYFNPNITVEESYENGRKFGTLIVLSPIIVVVLAALTDRLPFATKRSRQNDY